MTAPSAALPRAPRPLTLRAKIVTILMIVLVAGAAAFSGLNVGHHSTGTLGKLLVVFPIALAAGVGLAVLTLTEFKVFVAVLLVARASVDISKISGRAGGSTVPNAGSHAVDPSSMLSVLLILAGVLWLAAQLRAKGKLPGSGLRTALVVFIVAGFVSVIGDGTNRVTSSVECLRVLSVVVMFAVLEQLMRNRKDRRVLIWAIMASAIIPLLYTSLGFLTGHPNTDVKGGYTRIIGTFHESNDFGRYLMLMIIFAAALYPHVSQKQRRWLAVGLVPASVFLILTYTRTALIGTVVGLIIVGAYQSKRLLKVLAIAAVCSLVLVPSLASRFTSVASTSSLSANSAAAHSGDSFSWRLGYWTEVLPLANNNPVTGIGLGETQYNTNQAKAPHNDYIRAYVETGVVGLLAYLAMLVCLVQLGRKAIKYTIKGTFDRGVAIATLASAVAYVLVSAAANVLSSVEILWYLFGFAAASSAIIAENRARMELSPQLLTPLTP